MVNHPNRRRKIAPETAPVYDHDAIYAAFLVGVQHSFETAIASGRLFTTSAEGLNDVYLGALPADRQTHTCTACRHFIERYGSLVTIDANGNLSPAMWSARVPDFYWPAVIAMGTLAQRARVTGVFLSADATWGTPQTRNRVAAKVYTHLAVKPPAGLRFKHALLTPGQAMAAKREDFNTVARALTEFTPAMLDEALRLLETESLYRSERDIAPVKWLRALCDRPKGKNGENTIWRAVAEAPDGYCHPRASVVGTLLEDIAAGLPFAAIKANFDAKMHPLRYQRPQAAPTAGNIEAAEKVVEKLGIARSLERRFARLDEIETVWQPKAISPPRTEGGMFGHLRAKGSEPPVTVDIPAAVMTWEKFSKTVLGSAQAIELAVPRHGSFIALTTAEHADSPLIFKWDHPVAWYVYPGGSSAKQWGLRAEWVRVNAISPLPPMWREKPQPFLGEGMIFVLDGCADTREAGNAVFPECLRGELHAVRSTIEAYSRGAKLGGRQTASACGYDLRKAGGTQNISLRVLNNGRWTPYKIDRWD